MNEPDDCSTPHLRHLSFRFPLHDPGWDGTVSATPAWNAASRRLQRTFGETDRQRAVAISRTAVQPKHV